MAKLFNKEKINEEANPIDTPGTLKLKYERLLELSTPPNQFSDEALKKELKSLLDATVKLGPTAYALTGEIYCRYHHLVGAEKTPDTNAVQKAIKERKTRNITVSSPVDKPDRLSEMLHGRKDKRIPLTLPEKQPDEWNEAKRDIPSVMDKISKKGF